MSHIRWVRCRHDRGWMFYEGYAFNKAMEEERVATVAPSERRGAKKYVAQYLDHSSFRCYTIKDAKLNLEAIHNASATWKNT